MALFRALLRDRSGATAIEYGLLAMFCALAIVGTLEVIGTQVMGFYSSAHDGFGGR